MTEQTQENINPVLTFEGKKYSINDLPKETKDILRSLKIAETQLKMYEDTLKLISISRNTLLNQLREKLKNLD